MSEEEKTTQAQTTDMPEKEKTKVILSAKSKTSILIICAIMLLWMVIQLISDSQLIRFYRPGCPACEGFKITWKLISLVSLFDPRFNVISYDTTTEEGKEKAIAFGVKTVPSLVRTHPRKPVTMWQSYDREFSTLLKYAGGQIDENGK